MDKNGLTEYLVPKYQGYKANLEKVNYEIPNVNSHYDDLVIEYVADKLSDDSPTDLHDGEKTVTGKVIDGAHASDLNQTITRTINITTPDGTKSTKVQTAKIYRDASYDNVTGAVTYGEWSTAKWSKFTPDAIKGYTPSESSVPAVEVKNGQQDETVNITYTANEQTGKISYQDTDGKEIDSTTITGKTGETITVTPEVPAGWKIVDGQDIPKTVTATADGISTVIVKIEHAAIIVTPDTPKDDIPNGKVPGDPNKTYEKMDNLTITPTRTIIVTKPDGSKQTITQSVEFTRTATFDEVTGKITYSEWTFKSSSARDKGQDWDAFTPENISGYTANPSQVTSETVTSTTSSVTVTITYTANGGQNSGDDNKPDNNPDNKPDNKPDEKPDNKPSKPNKPVKPSKPEKPGKDKDGKDNKDKTHEKKNAKGKNTQSENNPKGEDAGKRKGYSKNGPINAEQSINGPLHAAKNVVSSESKTTGPKGASMNNATAQAIRGQKDKNELPQTGAAHDSLFAWLGSLFAGLSLFSLAADRKHKKKDNK